MTQGDGSCEHSDMASQRIFKILSAAVGDGTSARLGQLALPGRKLVETPNFTSVASRGAVPHLTPDNVTRHTDLSSTYMALEDFIEKPNAAIYEIEGEGEDSRPLHAFTAFPKEIPTILAARRCPAVTAPSGNTSKLLAIFTSTGFRSISIAEYAEAARKLKPDVVVGPADLLHSSQAPAAKKQLRMTERTEDWLDQFLGLLKAGTRTDSNVSESCIFAPLIPVEWKIQWAYLRHLAEEVLDDVSGLAVYDVNLMPELSAFKFGHLPKLSLDPPRNPQGILRQVSLGIDICLVPFVNNVSDAGVALTFSFPAPKIATGIQPLGTNMWSLEHQTSLAPLVESCTCYACQKHHRAFVNHLLNAKEMLGWTLLQIHNHHVLTEFFKGIREALAQGPEEFEALAQEFATVYDSEIPAGTGERPRARGYHFKSEHHQEKYNPRTWQDLNSNSNSGAEGTEKPHEVARPDGQPPA
ncbi:unnamed protein product [Clonostachys chloroleuca]|uniref:Queuine tRNA-ribosyltransferase accessory subunit 2 n=1 Tax=Clonostachys chloroleuca TaxID=1926264 RepID=A0AA35QE37_9HYPO|nr:unnamed protein product [Clonostachys chloroleuca]